MIEEKLNPVDVFSATPDDSTVSRKLPLALQELSVKIERCNAAFKRFSTARDNLCLNRQHYDKSKNRI
tara:strand:- start:517 stop:720 length:204 start_codon:yes stop_codon:yes gene_type:complete